MVVLEGLSQTSQVVRIAVVKQQTQISRGTSPNATAGRWFRSRMQRLASGEVQRERFCESTRGVWIGLAAAGFEMLDSPDAQPSSLGEGCLSKPGIDAVPPQKGTEQRRPAWRFRLYQSITPPRLE